MFNLLTFLLLPLLGSINSQSFPDVLSEDEENHYLSLWQKKDMEARNKLIEHNLRLVAHIVKKFESTHEDKDDLLSIGCFGLNEHFIETQKEIAKSLKISRSYVSRIEKRALTKLYLYLKENN